MSSYYRGEPQIVPSNNQIPRRLKPRFEIVILSVLMIAGCLDRGLAAAPADQKSLEAVEKRLVRRVGARGLQDFLGDRHAL